MSIGSQNGWLLQAGAALHVPSGPSLHLHVILNDPIAIEDYGSVVVTALVGISSVPTNPSVFFDNTCVLSGGCHPSIRHDSYVYYRGARIEQARDIEQRVRTGVYHAAPPVSAQVLHQIRAGLQTSKFTIREIQRIQWF